MHVPMHCVATYGMHTLRSHLYLLNGRSREQGRGDSRVEVVVGRSEVAGLGGRGARRVAGEALSARTRLWRGKLAAGCWPLRALYLNPLQLPARSLMPRKQARVLHSQVSTDTFTHPLPRRSPRT